MTLCAECGEECAESSIAVPCMAKLPSELLERLLLVLGAWCRDRGMLACRYGWFGWSFDLTCMLFAGSPGLGFPLLGPRNRRTMFVRCVGRLPLEVRPRGLACCHRDLLGGGLGPSCFDLLARVANRASSSSLRRTAATACSPARATAAVSRSRSA